MKRGVIVFSDRERAFALQLLTHLPSLTILRTKLQSASVSPPDQVKLEITEEEVNSMLDTLGHLDKDDPPEKQQLLKKLIQFLNPGIDEQNTTDITI